ncbi:MAG: hypothetical protein DKM50_12390 [Candidatus Margulisiibacteriota bacterium]|nr:MAG: hypothetical protein A2X43_04970 [Candidatus Margulisbacteria bacterium GWD2_39_127]OGI03606.1 MAG: hypothetical protein A2X42_01085 [Candidatus Margulisbacteria bacterium GWF2_38_17]OGI11110.1 MAG: hypothetical protein A2X41_02380 [Candidatus Margulisbacteria bacterium GWE2_39_32]PZM78141.1 MAG: hypothetical protein DKM50_12390 [Candidatus Margulisiibacteriota bacterium]HAR64381.1 hypothetical protein [Candidatus Margulisiibacteriota bacterium]
MSCCNEHNKSMEVEIEVNNKQIGLNPFIQEIVASTILGLLKPLKGTEGHKEIVIKLREK